VPDGGRRDDFDVGAERQELVGGDLVGLDRHGELDPALVVRRTGRRRVREHDRPRQQAQAAG
jgi:hypothetical protein